MRFPSSELPVSEALALGALQGPAELLPVSSSAHLAVIPWLLGWKYPRVDVKLRKEFEVALHAGTAAALLIALRDEVGTVLREPSRRLVVLIGLSFTPPAMVGYALERPIERHLGTPRTIAAGLLAGAIGIAWADRAPQLRGTLEARPLDALCLGVAQACALIPGVSRSGATLAAARARRFTRRDAGRLSRHVALPVIAGAGFLKGVRVRRRGLPAGTGLPFALGAGASFVSTLCSSRLIAELERDRPLAPYAIYRLLLAAVVLARASTEPGTMER